MHEVAEQDMMRLSAIRHGCGEIWSCLLRIPLVFKVQGIALLSALVVALGIANVAVHQGYQVVAFAIPAAEETTVPWDMEVAAFGSKVSQAFGVRRSTATEFAGWILEASERQNLEPELLASLVLTESSFRKTARSSVGAVGPAQVRPDYWSRFCGSSDLLDPAENIYCGAQVLSHLQERCGGVSCALEAYNVGIHSSRDKAARRYVAKVDRHRDQLRNFPL
ncbi:MAG: lytic transglycosylase domain-containing protein [Gammaproteobacteria bacterium]|nr:lytic transglycosylase domain-containing protein [Gammaproteobacteria bacterium]